MEDNDKPHAKSRKIAPLANNNAKKSSRMVSARKVDRKTSLEDTSSEDNEKPHAKSRKVDRKTSVEDTSLEDNDKPHAKSRKVDRKTSLEVPG